MDCLINEPWRHARVVRQLAPDAHVARGEPTLFLAQ
jgi:hypothetical protein